MTNSQQTSSPYSPDVLQPRDTGLIWAREWGTNTTDDLGDPLDTDPTFPTGEQRMFIDPRTGRVMCRSATLDAQSNRPRGATWLLPDWSQGPDLFPDEPLTAGLKGATLYAALDQVDTNLPQGSWTDPIGVNAPGLILAGPQCTGDIETEEFNLVELWAPREGEFQAAGPPLFTFPAQGVSESYWADAATPPAAAAWRVCPGYTGGRIYIRIVMTWTALAPQTQGNLAISTDGNSWVETGTVQLVNADPASSVARRVGLVGRNQQWGALNWARLYQNQFPGSQAEIAAELGVWTNAVYRLTGGRLFG